jgi:hypothetical protein
MRSSVLAALVLLPFSHAWAASLGGVVHKKTQRFDRARPPVATEHDPLTLVKEAGMSGVVSYFCVEVSFFALALPAGYFVWHVNTGEWLQPLLLLQQGTSEDKLRLVGLLLSYIVLLKTAFPLRLGATLLLTPKMRAFLSTVEKWDMGN